MRWERRSGRLLYGQGRRGLRREAPCRRQCFRTSSNRRQSPSHRYLQPIKASSPAGRLTVRCLLPWRSAWEGRKTESFGSLGPEPMNPVIEPDRLFIE
ncbi:hypothetical protein BHE74_00015867 [Ensete ventricosum]|nr:hypothetical protein BHE74_00015867 [Ensete ventricosum]